MIDEMLAAGSTFDWISPLVSSVQDVSNGPSHTFLIPHGCGWSGYGVRDLLHRFDVQTWGLMIVSDTLMVSVPKDRASWAYAVLVKHGIPVENPPTLTHTAGDQGRPSANPALPGEQSNLKVRNSNSDADAVSGILRFADKLQSVMTHFKVFHIFADAVNGKVSER